MKNRMSNQKKYINKILAILATIFLLITPIAAEDTPTVTQNINVIIPEFIGINVNPTTATLNFLDKGNTTGRYQSEEVTVKNTGNIKINIGIKANGDLKSGNTTLNWTEYWIKNTAGTILLMDIRTDYISNFQVNLKPGDINISHLQVLGVPNTTPAGTYSASVTSPPWQAK